MKRKKEKQREREGQVERWTGKERHREGTKWKILTMSIE